MKGLKEIFSDIPTLLKLLEVICCLLGLIFFEFGTVFYSRWIMEMLIIGLGGYLLITAILFVLKVQGEDASQSLNLMFMLVGAILDILAGIMTIIRNSQRKKYIWVYVSVAGLNDDGDYEIFVAIFAIAAGVIMLIDFLQSL